MTKKLVFGHKNPDTDAITSAISFAYLRNQLGEEVEAVALGEISEETQFALDHFSYDAPRVIERASDEVETVYLVDHNEFQQSVDDIEDILVEGVVDHHRVANFESANPLFYRAEPVGCTQTVIYKLFKENDVEIPQNIAGLMLSAILSDTLNFKSPTCTPEDEKVARELESIAGVNAEEFGLELLKAGSNISTRTEVDILEGDAKSFSMADKYLRIGQVNVVDTAEVIERKTPLIEEMKKISEAEGYDVYLLIITDILTNDSKGLVYAKNEINETVVEQAFEAKLNDHELELPGVVSRKKQVIPPLTNAFEG